MPPSRVTGPAQGYCSTDRCDASDNTGDESSLPNSTLLNSYPLLYSTVLCSTLHVTTAQHDAQDPFTLYCSESPLYWVHIIEIIHWSTKLPLCCLRCAWESLADSTCSVFATLENLLQTLLVVYTHWVSTLCCSEDPLCWLHTIEMIYKCSPTLWTKVKVLLKSILT